MWTLTLLSKSFEFYGNGHNVFCAVNILMGFKIFHRVLHLKNSDKTVRTFALQVGNG